MYRKFACLNYVADTGEIPIRLNFPNKPAEAELKRYVEKYNPFAMEDFIVADEMGYKIKLPLTEIEACENPAKTELIVTKTINALKEYNVEIVLAPKNIKPIIDGKMKAADGVLLSAFFLGKAAEKVLRSLGKDIKYCEVAVVNGQGGNYPLTESVLDNIYEDVNFLTVADSGGNFEKLYRKSDFFLDDTGLNLIVSKISKSVFKTADVVINIGDILPCYDFAYMEKAVFFDLSDNPDRRRELALRRRDMKIISELRLKYNGCSMPVKLFELALYLKSREYRSIMSSGYTTQNGSAVRRMLDRMGVTVVSPTVAGLK